MPTTIVLVRHGETDWNRDNRFQGRADPPLNDTGRAQARVLAAELGDGELRRCVHEPAPASAQRQPRSSPAASGLDAVPDASLMEVDVGSWSGLTRTEVEARFPAGFARWLEYGHGWDDGETYDELGARVVSGLARHRLRSTRTTLFSLSRTAARSARRSRPPNVSRSTRQGARSTSSTTARSSGSPSKTVGCGAPDQRIHLPSYAALSDIYSTRGRG